MNYIIPFIISFIIALGLTPLVRLLVVKKNLAMALPRKRDVHIKPIPRLGGIAIYISFWIVVFGFYILYPDKLHFVNEKFLGKTRACRHKDA